MNLSFVKHLNLFGNLECDREFQVFLWISSVK